MRLLLASAAALAALAFAAPSFAQEEPAATPTPTTKAKPGTAAYCNTLKSGTSKNACLKRVHAQASTKKTTSGKGKAKKLNPPGETAAQLSTPAPMPPPAPSPAPAASSGAPTQSVAVPPLPQKTI